MAREKCGKPIWGRSSVVPAGTCARNKWHSGGHSVTEDEPPRPTKATRNWPFETIPEHAGNKTPEPAEEVATVPEQKSFDYFKPCRDLPDNDIPCFPWPRSRPEGYNVRTIHPSGIGDKDWFGFY